MNTKPSMLRAGMFVVALIFLCLGIGRVLRLDIGTASAQTPPPDLTATLVSTMTSPTSVTTLTTAARSQLAGCWSVDTNATTGTDFGGLQDIDGTGNNVWAVGYQPDRERTQAFTTHWDGAKWNRVPAPSFPNGSFLSGVSVVSKDDVWAVGVQGSFLSPPMRVLILHWDGRSWREVAAPNVSGRLSMLEDVAVVSPDNAWAVGYIEPLIGATGGRHAIILHWDGHAWAQVTTPAIPPTEAGSGYSTLESLIVLSKDDIWVVGAGPEGFSPMALHWNGSEWSRASMPTVKGLLHGVTAIAPDDIWAVGNRYPDDFSSDTLTMHWDGSTWSVVPSLGNSGAGRTAYWLHSVAALAKNDVWAVGEVTYHRAPSTMLILHWDGHEWDSVNTPGPALGRYATYLTSAVNVGGSIWMAGIHDTGVLLKYRASPCAPPVPVPGSGSHTFPETGKTMTGLFLDYWNTHGGLPQQGYPISDVIGEVSDLNGRLYTMQYTERAIFEYHPENAKPYDVLLSHLGRFQLRNRYPTGTPKQTPNDQPGSILFNETGKRLGGAFLKYWRENGGLMQQGFPLTDEFTEVSELDRKPYTVQYFERAVFEYHPELRGTQYEVLLSQLGTYRWRDKYGQNPSPTHTVSPTASPTTTPLARGVRGRAVANNRYLFWIKDDIPTFSIYGYDWEEKRTFLVTDRPGFKFSLATDDKTLVWGEGDVENVAGIRGYNILKKTEFVAVQPQNPASISEDTMVIDEAMLYYVGNIGGRYGIIARNIVTGQSNMVIERGRNPVIWGDTMVWSKEVATCTGNQPPCMFDQELYVRKANNDRLVARASGQTTFWEYDVWGDHVVWISPNYLPEGYPLNVYRISTASNNGLTAGSHPVINDALVAWASIIQDGGGAWLLKLHNLITAQTIEFVPRTGAYTEAQAFIGQGAIAYTVGGGKHPLMEKGDLYVVDLVTRP